MENKEYLIKKLKLSNAIVKNDKKAIEIAKEFKDLTREQNMGITDLVNGFIDSNTNIDILKETINLMEFDDKQYLLDMIELRQLNYFRDSSMFEKIIREKLESDKNYKDEIKNYMYYSLIVNLVISSKNSELIELAINKVQSV